MKDLSSLPPAARRLDSGFAIALTGCCAMLFACGSGGGNAIGSSGGKCRVTGDPCDPGLDCVENICTPPGGFADSSIGPDGPSVEGPDASPMGNPDARTPDPDARTAELVCDDRIDDDADGFTDCLDTECAADAACQFLTQLYIWEVDADDTSTDDLEFVEILNNTGATVDLAAGSYYLVLVNGSDYLTYNAFRLTGTVAAGDVFVVGSGTLIPAADQVIGATNVIQNGPDGVLIVRCPTCEGAAIDFPSDTDPGTTATFITGGGATATKIDGVVHHTGDAFDTTLQAKVGVTTQFDEGANGLKDTESIHRTSLTGFSTMLAAPSVAGIEP